MRLSKKWIDKLVALPENGMGYQFVDIYLKNGIIIRKVAVVNCEALIYRGNLSFSETDIQNIELAA